MEINADLMLAKPIPDGYTWTLASRLGNMLQSAQELFGPRDTTYTILGVEFVADNPRLWYPGSKSNRRDIIIQLGSNAATDVPQACYQLAHETVHLLAPTGSQNAINFEEGVACYFSFYYMNKNFSHSIWTPSLPSYLRAFGYVAPQLTRDIACVRRLREKQPLFSGIQREDLVKEFPDLDSEALDFLLSEFKRNAV